MAPSATRKSTKIVLILFFICFAVLQAYRFRVPVVDLRVGDDIITVQVANTLYRQKKGLGGRDDIGVYAGMLFPFDTQNRHAIVMRDMRFPLDIVWLKNGKIVDIATNLIPESGVSEGGLTRYYPRADANAIVEFPAGQAKVYGLKIGDTIEHLR